MAFKSQVERNKQLLKPLYNASKPVDGKKWLRCMTKSLKVYKKVRSRRYAYSNRCTVVELTIPVGALVVNSGDYNRKLRASEARVDKINDQSTKVGYSLRDCSFTYTVGKIVEPRYRFVKSRTTCASGIHFFLRYNDARNYPL